MKPRWQLPKPAFSLELLGSDALYQVRDKE
jgi:hypothetical protein